MRRTVAAVVVLLVVLAGCGDDSDGDSGDDSDSDSADSDPAEVIEEYRVAYNAGDIDAVMALFSEESVVTGHPFFDSTGLTEIRRVQLEDMADAAAADAYEISDVEVTGDTVTWDHVWTNRTGQDYCADGHSAVIADGKILAWTWALNPQLCADTGFNY